MTASSQTFHKVQQNELQQILALQKELWTLARIASNIRLNRSHELVFLNERKVIFDTKRKVLCQNADKVAICCDQKFSCGRPGLSSGILTSSIKMIRLTSYLLLRYAILNDALTIFLCLDIPDFKFF
ncbi:MAG: hypothetical protein LBR89_04120 [Holosporales bacterium]|nr:hypothetical protein [Holosporales bacterium]